MKHIHSLRFRLTAGSVIVLALALMLCCTLIISASSKVIVSSAVSVTVAEEQTLLTRVQDQLRKIGTVSNENALHYVFKSISAQSGPGCEYVLQLADSEIYNNSGISPYVLLHAKGTQIEVDNEEYQFLISAINGESYCVVGYEFPYYQDAYTISVVKNVTEQMGQIQDLQVYCLTLGFIVTLIAALLIALFLANNLNPLQILRRNAEAIASGDYSDRISVPQNDEIGMVADSFNRMAEAVETHIAEVEKTSQERNMLLHALSHEMRTPVTAISGYAYALTHMRMHEEQKEEALEFLESESRRLERLYTKLTQLLTVTDSQIEFAPINPEEFENRINSLLAPMAEKHGICLEIQMGCTPIIGDSDLLLMLLTNLYDNARKAGASIVSITLSDRTLSVSDNGCGIPEEILDKIMQPFFQGDASRNQEGFGLGLALCRRIALLHGSDLMVESASGKGTTFTTLLQIHDDSQTAQTV